MSDLVVVETISQKAGRTTQIVTYKGKKCIAKRIDIVDPGKKGKLIEQLKKQVTFSEKLSEADRHQIILFNQMIEDGSSIVFLRDYVEGESMEKLISGQKLEWKEAVKWIKAIALIVQRSHSLHLVHGDLKPANILKREDDNTWCIIDWDTMRIFKFQSDGKTATVNDMPGTPEYMSPEQCAGNPIDEKTDVYALGTILYQLLTGKTPFSGDSLKIMSSKQKEPLQPFVGKYPNLGPNSLGSLIDDALAINTNLRVQSIDQFISRLDKISNTGIDTGKGGGTHVIIGPPQSGKTVMAAGLYRSHRKKNFIVSALDENTRKYADTISGLLQDGKWPAASPQELKTLHFKLNISDWTGTYSGDIEFCDYSGEFMYNLDAKSFVEKFIGAPETADNLKTVLFLINPNAPWIADTYQDPSTYQVGKNSNEKNDAFYRRQDVLSKIEACINYLVNLPNRPAVAVVITAADRLESDLKPYKEQFEEVVTRICSLLTLNKCTWKRFDVSICKPLKKQDELVFNPQHIHEPFVWAFQRKRRAPILKWIKGIVACLLLLILGCLAYFGNNFRVDKNNADLILQKAAQVDKEYTPRETIDKQHKYVLQLDKVLEENKSQEFKFKFCEKRYEKNKAELKSTIDNAYIEYVKKQLEEFQKSDSTVKDDIIKKRNEIKERLIYVDDNKKKIAALDGQMEDLIIDKTLQEFEKEVANVKSKPETEKKTSLLELYKKVNGYGSQIPKDGDFRNRYDSISKEINDELEKLYGKEFKIFAEKLSLLDSYENVSTLFNDFITEHRDNPHCSEVEKLFCEKVETMASQIIKNCFNNTNNQPEYTALKEICASFIKFGDKPYNCEYVRSRNLYKFAHKYQAWYDNNRKYTITVTAIYGSSSFNSGGYIYKINDIPGPEKWWWTKKTFQNAPVRIDLDRNENSDYWDKHAEEWKKFKNSLTSTLEPWEKYQIKVEQYINNATKALGFSDKGKPLFASIHPTEANDTVTRIYFMGEYNSIKVVYKVTGKLLGDIVKECGLLDKEQPSESDK